MTELGFKIMVDSNPHTRGAQDLEQVLCLATLIAAGEKGMNDIEDAKYFYAWRANADCGECPHLNHCLACMINE